MRLWSLHSQYLDRQGLLAVWREGLLAKKVLEGSTRGYINHPQLARFRQQSNPLVAINSYLYYIWQESVARNYTFDRTKLAEFSQIPLIPVTTDQLLFELNHLKSKLEIRNPHLIAQLPTVPQTHPLFTPVGGRIESWERGIMRDYDE